MAPSLHRVIYKSALLRLQNLLALETINVNYTGDPLSLQEIKHSSRANALPSVDVVSHPTARLLQDVVCCTQLLDFFRKSSRANALTGP
ncbi:unnamed protein product [Rodentolepis nana]|uniref:Uncharacterized protein n=1 Tax=Rodentolepis nana TaxID=102285 RepID=A0A0R3TMV2_RODNA|nr:unnamed protein product [Rodentolepis nana]